MTMRDYITIGSTPADEDCAQLGSDNYRERMRKESAAFIAQILREFGLEPEGARLAVKGFPHDFGTYHEVVCYYDDSLPASVEYAFKVESPSANWDAQARAELGLDAPEFGE
jgi:hypothetical protein